MTVSIDDALRRLRAPAPEVVQDQLVPITNLHLALYRYRTDVAGQHDLGTRAGRHGFLSWLYNHGRHEMLAAPAQPMPAVPPPGSAFGVNSIGYAHGELGLGQQLRTAAAALRGHGVPVAIVPIATRNGLPENERALAALEDPRMPYRVSLFHLNGLMQLLLLYSHGDALFRGRCNVGIWAWELERWPVEMALCCALNDEIWAISRYVADSLANVTNVPVRVMPETVEVPAAEPYPLHEHGIRPGAFTFLVAFDASSSLRRKNPLGAIEAFRRAFAPGENVALVVKAMAGDRAGADWAAVQRAASGDARIVLVDTVLAHARVHALFRACDAYVSLHRAEGFGRCIAEAMLCGTPCVVSNYSGNTDFCDADNSYLVDCRRVPVQRGEYPLVFDEPNHWGEPSVEHAAAQMRAVVVDPARRARVAAAARHAIASRYAAPVSAAAYATRLAELHADRAPTPTPA